MYTQSANGERQTVIKAESIRGVSQTSGAADVVTFSGEIGRSTPSPDEGAMDVVLETPSSTPLAPVQTSSLVEHDQTVDKPSRISLQLRLEQMDSLRGDFQTLERQLDSEKTGAQEKLYWEDRARSSETECQRLRVENGNLRHKTEIAFGADGLATLDRMFRTDQRVADLKKQLRQLENIRPEAQRPQLPRLNFREVEEQHQDMVCGLACIFSEQDFVNDLTRLDIDHESDLHELCRKAQVLGVSTPEGNGKVPLKFSADVQFSVRALLAAALSSWVLEADLRDLFPDLGFGSRFRASRRLYEKLWGLLTARGRMFETLFVLAD
jgi:hypothetical protein